MKSNSYSSNETYYYADDNECVIFSINILYNYREHFKDTGYLFPFKPHICINVCQKIHK